VNLNPFLCFHQLKPQSTTGDNGHQPHNYPCRPPPIGSSRGFPSVTITYATNEAFVTLAIAFISTFVKPLCRGSSQEWLPNRQSMADSPVCLSSKGFF